MLSKYALLSTRTHEQLAQKIGIQLRTPLTKCRLTKFKSGELRVQVNESVRGKNVYIVHTGYSLENFSVNDGLVELMSMVDVCRRSNAGSITLLLPHYPYSRDDKKDHGRGSINAAMVTNVLESLGVNRIVSLELHSPSIQGFFKGPFDNLYSGKLFKSSLKHDYGEEIKKFIVISPDHGGVKRASAFAKLIGVELMIMSKTRSKVNEVASCVLIGDESKLEDSRVVIFDDMLDTGGTMCKAINELGKYKIKGVVLCVAHGLFSDGGLERVCENKLVDSVYCTNSVPTSSHLKLKVCGIEQLYANVIQRLEGGGSLSDLFE